MFILLVKAVLFIMHLFLPLLSLFVSGLMLALYAVSLRNQSAPDMSDPDNPSPGLPWYLSKGCQYATQANKGYCMQARGAFGVTCAMVYVSSLRRCPHHSPTFNQANHDPSPAPSSASTSSTPSYPPSPPSASATNEPTTSR